MGKFYKVPVSALIMVWLVGCAYQPTNDVTAVELTQYAELPFEDSFVFVDSPQTEWWQGYRSEDLNWLFEELENSSFDLATARQRIIQARSILGQQNAASWPSLSVRLSQSGARDFDTSNTSDNSSLDFSAAYEVDLFGSRSAADYGAELGVVISEQEYQSLRLQTEAALAQAYFDYIATRDRLVIAEQNFEASRELLEIIQVRFESGSASGIEVRQQQNTYLSAQSSVLALNRELATSERALAVILGRESLDMGEMEITFAEIQLPEVGLVQPARLLEYRPDIRVAEANYRIQETDLYQQRQKRWPTLNLSAGMGLDDALNGGSSWVGSLVGALAMPLIDGGSISQQIISAEAGLEIAELEYRQTVLVAMQEALDTLTDFQYQQLIVEVRAEELTNNLELYDLARLRYEAGEIDFLNLLTAQRSWFSARDNLIQAKNDQLLATLNVYKAMGVAPESIGQQ